MNAIVIYKSNTGFTKKYAEWIAQELECKKIVCKIFAYKDVRTIELNRYDIIIYGGSVFVGSIQELKEFKEKLLLFKGKKAIFAVGAMPADSPEVEPLLKTCLSEDEHKTIGTFYLQGGLDYSKMSFINKFMMKMMCKMMKKEKGIDSVEYKIISQSFNATDKDAINPLINYIMS